MRQMFLAFLLAACCAVTLYGQASRQFSDKSVVVGDNTFLPYYHGEVIKLSGDAPAHLREIAAAVLLCDSINTPQGFKVRFYGDGNFLTISLEPYVLNDGEVYTMPGALIDMFLDDFSGLFRQSVVEDIYIQPVKRADFMGYPVYDNGSREMTVICKNSEPLFVPVSRGEYLMALIRAEEKRVKENGSVASTDETLEEMKKAYKLLLETDKEAAAEFKKEIDDFAADLTQDENVPDMLSLLKEELSKLSPGESKSQAYFEQGLVGENGYFSGLSDSKSEFAQPLVRPNNKIVNRSDSFIQLLIIQWNLGSVNENRYAPRFFKCKRKIGFGLTDCRLVDLCNDSEVWSRVAGYVR